jgi:hypothetical protein
MKRKELEKALSFALPGTEKMASGGMDQVLFDGEWIRSYNETLSVSYPFKADIEIAVKAEEFYKIVRKMSGEEVDLKLDEKKLIVSNKSTKLTLYALPAGAYKQLKDNILSLKVDEWSPIPKGFAEGLPLSLLSGLTDSHLGRISGVAFRGNSIVSTDNFQVGHYQMESGITDELFRLKLSSVEGLIRLRKDFEFVSIIIAESVPWLSLKAKDGIVISVRILAATGYPIDEIIGEIDKHIDKDQAGYEFPKGLEEALDRVEVLAYEEDEDFKTLICLKTEGGNLVVSSKRSFGEIEDRIPWDVELPQGEFYTSPGWLKRILKITRKFKICSKGLIFSEPKFQYLMMTKGNI